MEVTAPVQRVIELLRQMGLNPKGPFANKHGSPQFECRCPAHDDRMPSLGVSVGREGDCVLNCQAGCSKDDILKALGLTMADLFLKRNNPRSAAPPRKPHNPQNQPKTPSPTTPPAKLAPKPRKIHPTLERAISAAKWSTAQRLEVPEDQVTFAGQWDYHNAAGRVAATVIRFDLPKAARDERAPKQFVPLHPNGDGWSIGDPPRNWPLYHLPDVIAAVTAKRRVFFTEGEKAADAVRSLGLVATTTAHGAKSPRGTDFTPLAGVDEVICFPDNDESGREFAKIVNGMILATAPLARVRTLELPGLPEKGDFVEFLAARRNHPDYPNQATILAELDALITAAPVTKNPPKQLVLDHRHPLECARAYLEACCVMGDGGVALRRHAENFFRWSGSQYQELEEEDIRSDLYRFLDTATRAIGGPFKPNRSIVANVLDALAALQFVSITDTPPLWMIDSPDHPDPREILACKSKLLHLPTRNVLPATPHFFTTCAAPFDYDAGATVPSGWVGFLNEIFEGDADQIGLLQEWFGYCLTPDTRKQKMLLVVGPTRSGKGTIGRILTAMLGEKNVGSPTISGFASNFGLSSLLNKTLAIVPDARIGGNTNESVIVERLLSISGEDRLDIDRKNKTLLSVKLPTRLMILSNELPKLRDASAALAGRFLTLTTKQSFYGREDETLEPRLLGELPGILNWSLDGLDRLRARRRFVEPDASRFARQQMEDYSSTARPFVRDFCVTGADQSIDADRLWEHWKEFCQEQGMTKSFTRSSLEKELQTMVPGFKAIRAGKHRGTRFRKYEGIAIPGEMGFIDFANSPASPLASPPRQARVTSENERKIGYQQTLQIASSASPAPRVKSNFECGNGAVAQENAENTDQLLGHDARDADDAGYTEEAF